MYNSYMYCNDGKIFIEEDDQCLDCANYTKGLSCPLLTALGLGVVSLEDNLTVTNCGFLRSLKELCIL
ncbi:MAG: hypothetical protein ACLSA2_10350 [Candidatus Gastranaerophilaceae bacterium]